MQPLNLWLQAALKHAGLQQQELAALLSDHLGRFIDPATMQKMTIGKRNIRADEMLAIEEITRYPIPSQNRNVRGPDANMTELLDIDPRGGAEAPGGEPRPGGLSVGQRQTGKRSKPVVLGGIARMNVTPRNRYLFPDAFVREHFHISGDNPALMLEVVGDAGSDPVNPYAPGSLLAGERIIVDVGDRHPMPAGIFACHDGVHFFVKNLEMVPGEKEQVRMFSRNPLYPSTVVPLKAIDIVGRVRCRIMWM
jgi:hypothetical protein